jgi:hypothetical protein
MPSGLSHAPRMTRGFRTGIVIGMAIAILGLAVGTVTGATTPFQQVLVVNAPSSPIPVAQQGAVSISNLPADQSVTVSNFPATQPVSGTVNVGNLPATQVASKSWSEADTLGNDGGFKEYSFGRTINATNLFIANQDEDNMSVGIRLANGDSSYIWSDDGQLAETFPVPTPMTGVFVFCYNLVLDCHFDILVVGT